MDRTRIGLVIVFTVLTTAVVAAGIYRNDISYSSTGAMLAGVVTLLITGGKKRDEDDDR